MLSGCIGSTVVEGDFDPQFQTHTLHQAPDRGDAPRPRPVTAEVDDKDKETSQKLLRDNQKLREKFFGTASNTND